MLKRETLESSDFVLLSEEDSIANGSRTRYFAVLGWGEGLFIQHFSKWVQ